MRDEAASGAGIGANASDFGGDRERGGDPFAACVCACDCSGVLVRGACVCVCAVPETLSEARADSCDAPLAKRSNATQHVYNTQHVF